MTLHTESGERIVLMDDSLAAPGDTRLLETALRKMGRGDMAGWLAGVREEEHRAAALEHEERAALHHAA